MGAKVSQSGIYRMKCTGSVMRMYLTSSLAVIKSTEGKIHNPMAVCHWISPLLSDCTSKHAVNDSRSLLPVSSTSQQLQPGGWGSPCCSEVAPTCVSLGAEPGAGERQHHHMHPPSPQQGGVSSAPLTASQQLPSSLLSLPVVPPRDLQHPRAVGHHVDGPGDQAEPLPPSR